MKGAQTKKYERFQGNLQTKSLGVRIENLQKFTLKIKSVLFLS
jgi:hypothetical protein